MLPSFSEIVRDNQNMVFSLALHSLGNRAQAEDLTQEVFLSLHQHLGELESADHVRHWLRRVASNRCIDESRRQKYRRGPALDEVVEPSASMRLVDPMLQRHLEQSLASLPAEARMITILRYQEEMQPQEIAAALDIPVATVRTRLHRALTSLRERMLRKQQVVKGVKQ
jgi:RNA polymerase sigma-70 factor, ECF subfamily